MKKLIRAPLRLALLIFALSSAIKADGLMAQSVTVLHNFGSFSGDGVLPNGVCLGGNALYGTTEQGGDNGVGTVFAVGTNGSTYSVLHSFAYFNSTLPNPTNSEGGYPQAGVVLFSNTLFGTTSRAGSNSCGTVYCLETNGANFRVLHTFAGTSDGAHPDTSLIVSGNVLYGAAGGGASNTGTIFSLNADGTGFKVLYSFSLAPFNFALGLNTNSDGAFPHALVLAGGVLYGLTEDGGPYGDGTTFALGTNGAGFTVLRTSGGPRELIVSGSTIYGDSYATVFAFNTNGTGFTNFFSVPNGFNGLGGDGALTLAGDLFYGTVFTNGGYGSGSVFSLGTNGGGFSVLHTFPGGSDGENPCGTLSVSGDVLYGTTGNGGANTWGTIFALSLPASLSVTNAISSLSLSNGVFGFDVSGPPNSPLVIEACTNLARPAWIPLSTNAITSSTFHFSDPAWTNYPQRFYRVVPP